MAPGTAHRLRVWVAVALSVWTVLEAATLVRAAAIGTDNPALVYPFFFTSLFTMGLAAASWVAWRWVLRRRPVAPGAPSEQDGGDAEPPARHQGLSGEQAPPTRW